MIGTDTTSNTQRIVREPETLFKIAQWTLLQASLDGGHRSTGVENGENKPSPWAQDALNRVSRSRQIFNIHERQVAEDAIEESIGEGGKRLGIFLHIDNP